MTTNDVAVPQASGTALAAPAIQTSTTIGLQEWASELDAAHRLATALASSNFVPMNLRKKGKDSWKRPEELTMDVTALILAGKSIGYDPMQAIQQLFIVHGMPSMYSRSMVALVLSHGHEIERSAATYESVTYRARRKGSTEWQEFTWDIGRARKAGYTSNSKYESDPIAMLGAKAATEACRVMFPDVLLGMAYSVEEIELEDLGESGEPPAAPAPTAEKKKITRKPRAAAPAPDLPAAVNDAPRDQEEPASDEADAREETGEMCSPDQWTHLTVALKAAGYGTKPQMRNAVEGFLGRSTNGPEDITADEASRMQEHFTTLPAAADADQQWLDGVPA